jgi:hypothetical protein
MPSPAMNPHARNRRQTLAAHDRLGGRATWTLLAAVWTGALLLAGLGVRARYGEWPGVVDWLVVTPLLTLFAMPAGLLDLLGLPYGGGTAMLHATFLALWAVMLVLHVLALLTGRRVYVALIAILLAPAAWNWAVHAVGLMGI